MDVLVKYFYGNINCNIPIKTRPNIETKQNTAIIHEPSLEPNLF